MLDPSEGSVYFSETTSVSDFTKSSRKTIFSKQPFRGVFIKRCSENMQQVYRRTPMPKCDFNKVAKQPYWNHTSAWVFCKLAAYFQKTSEGHLLIFSCSNSRKSFSSLLSGQFLTQSNKEPKKLNLEIFHFLSSLLSFLLVCLESFGLLFLL